MESDPNQDSDAARFIGKGDDDDVDRMYALRGPQVEPCASFWLDEPAICVPPRKDVMKHAESGKKNRLALVDEHFPDNAALQREFGILKELEARRFIDPWVAVELRRMANNIGEARLWAGVHWISDHLAGQRIGRSAAQAVIEVLQRDCIPPYKKVECDNDNLPAPPDREELEKECARSRKRPCADDQHFIPQPDRDDRQELLRHFGVF